ncbi:MAG: hypothetical protein JW847_01785 [Candidatus Omnitrophica bacterium]|nr:hypothetical protein [Candidatus Omnitrophota bacterium]
MRTIKIFAILFVGILVTAGCAKVEHYGQPLSLRETTKVIDILKNPGQYIDKMVKVEGKIANECPTGCWFNVTDETGTLYIDLLGANIAIPQKVGHDVILEGTIKERSGVPIIHGTGVDIK